MTKSKGHRGRSKTDRLSSTPRRHHGVTTESLSTSAINTPALIHSPRPRSANRTEISSAFSTPRSGARSEVNSTVGTPVLLNSPAKSSTISRSLATSGLKDKPVPAVKDSKPPSGISDSELKTIISKPRRKQSNEMSKSFELHLQTDVTVDTRSNKSLSVRSVSSSQDFQAKMSSKENLEHLKSKSDTDNSRTKQKSSSDNSKAQLRVKESSSDTSSFKEDSKLKSVREDTKVKGHYKAKPRLPTEQLKIVSTDAKKSTGDEDKVSERVAGVKSAIDEGKKVSERAVKTTPEEEKLKSKLPNDKDKIKQSIDNDKNKDKGVGDEKEKMKSSDKDKLKQDSFTGSHSEAKPKPSSISKCGHDDVKKRTANETLKDAKRDSSTVEREPKKNAQIETKKEKVNGINGEQHSSVSTILYKWREFLISKYNIIISMESTTHQ